MKKILSESLITRIYNVSNMFVIDVSNPVRITTDSHLSFYDPTMFKSENCIHSTEAEGVYTIFKEK